MAAGSRPPCNLYAVLSFLDSLRAPVGNLHSCTQPLCVHRSVRVFNRCERALSPANLYLYRCTLYVLYCRILSSWARRQRTYNQSGALHRKASGCERPVWVARSDDGNGGGVDGGDEWVSVRARARACWRARTSPAVSGYAKTAATENAGGRQVRSPFVTTVCWSCALTARTPDVKHETHDCVTRRPVRGLLRCLYTWNIQQHESCCMLN